MLRKLYGIVSSGSVVGSFIAIVPITLAVGLIYTVYRIAKSKKNDAPTAWGKEIIKLLFVLYLTGLANLTLVPPNLWTSVWARIVVGYSSERPAFFSGGFNFVPTVFGLISGNSDSRTVDIYDAAFQFPHVRPVRLLPAVRFG